MMARNQANRCQGSLSVLKPTGFELVARCGRGSIVPLSTTHTHQPALPGLCNLSEAVEGLANAGIEGRGAIFTRREVVDFILDIAGYTVDKPLHSFRALEPSFGGGDFLFAVVERLIASYRRAEGNNPVTDLAEALRAVELHRASFEKTSEALQILLVREGISAKDARALRGAWLVRDDFLLAPLNGTFTHIVGNPPYVRQELIPQILIEEYRRRYRTIYDRADIYIPFIERSLMLLAPGGALSFICADRWMKNRYGGPLRKLVAEHFHLRAYVDMVDTPAFLSDVIAYPAIFLIANERGHITRLAHRPAIDSKHLTELAKAITAEGASSQNSVKEIGIATRGSEPWLLESLDQLAIVRRLEQQYPTVEEASCKVGIGVATGADNAFIAPLHELDVEADRKLPLVMTRDILTGSIKWRGFGVVNPFAASGRLVNLNDYPRLKAYLEERKGEIAKRHVAQKMPSNWFRTIDRIYPELVEKPKLLIPDIKGEAQIVYDAGAYYPHHNLYFITSEAWDLHALQAVLLSGIARLFISTYSTKMRGGYLRFQAQYLRRIRIPFWNDVSPRMRAMLSEAGRSGDQAACNNAVIELYGLTGDELNCLADTREAA
jgi:TaqI-like C-terminal specificity domain/Eco57I restriction-modification methylase